MLPEIAHPLAMWRAVERQRRREALWREALRHAPEVDLATKQAIERAVSDQLTREFSTIE